MNTDFKDLLNSRAIEAVNNMLSEMSDNMNMGDLEKVYLHFYKNKENLSFDKGEVLDMEDSEIILSNEWVDNYMGNIRWKAFVTRQGRIILKGLSALHSYKSIELHELALLSTLTSKRGIIPFVFNLRDYVRNVNLAPSDSKFSIDDLRLSMEERVVNTMTMFTNLLSEEEIETVYRHFYEGEEDISYYLERAPDIITIDGVDIDLNKWGLMGYVNNSYPNWEAHSSKIGTILIKWVVNNPQYHIVQLHELLFIAHMYDKSFELFVDNLQHTILTTLS